MVTVSGNSNPTNPTDPTTINSGELTDKNPDDKTDVGCILIFFGWWLS